MKNEAHSNGSNKAASVARKCWMVVDDNQDILEAMECFLADMTDARIECFNSPRIALTAFAAAPEKYELVMTDFEMPELNGMQFCKRLHGIVPDLKICLVTGSECFTPLEARREGFSGLLGKPFLRAELKQMLAEVLAQSDVQPEQCNLASVQ